MGRKSHGTDSGDYAYAAYSITMLLQCWRQQAERTICGWHLGKTALDLPSSCFPSVKSLLAQICAVALGPFALPICRL